MISLGGTCIPANTPFHSSHYECRQSRRGAQERKASCLLYGAPEPHASLREQHNARAQLQVSQQVKKGPARFQATSTSDRHSHCWQDALSHKVSPCSALIGTLPKLLTCKAARLLC